VDMNRQNNSVLPNYYQIIAPSSVCVTIPARQNGTVI
jgi:hypothetical protein